MVAGEDGLAGFDAFVAEHRGYAIRLAHRLLAGDPEGALDVAQDAFVRAHSGWGGFRGEASRKTWLTRILVNAARSHQRAEAVRRRVFFWRGDRDTPALGLGPESEAYGHEIRERVGAAVGRLSPQQREVFTLVHLEGMTVNEAAQILERAPGTVKSHLHRALLALRRELADLRSTEADRDSQEVRS